MAASVVAIVLLFRRRDAVAITSATGYNFEQVTQKAGVVTPARIPRRSAAVADEVVGAVMM